MSAAGQLRAATVGWVYQEFFKRHRTGRDHPDQPERLEVIVEALRGAGLLDRLARLDFGPAALEDLALVHEPAYVDLVRLACEQGVGFIGDRETHLSAESYDVAALAAGGVLAACDAVVEGRVGRAFCAVRPPGHHAERDRAMGFCLFNHVAVAAEHLIRRRGLRRVAVIDFDVHHGNGTHQAFEARKDVLYVSLHEHPLSLRFPGTGWPGDTGSGEGEGYSRNVCMAHGSDDAAYRRAFEGKVRPAVDDFAPEFLLVSAGFDAYRTEWLAHVNLESASFGWLTRELVRLAEAHCGGRLVSVLEGGYDLEHLGPSALEHVRALAEEPI